MMRGFIQDIVLTRDGIYAGKKVKLNFIGTLPTNKITVSKFLEHIF